MQLQRGVLRIALSAFGQLVCFDDKCGRLVARSRCDIHTGIHPFDTIECLLCAEARARSWGRSGGPTDGASALVALPVQIDDTQMSEDVNM